MNVRLRPLREDEWPAFVEEGKRQYADDMATSTSAYVEGASAVRR